MKVVLYPQEVPSCVFNLRVVTLNMLCDAVKLPYSKSICFFFFYIMVFFEIHNSLPQLYFYSIN